MGIGTGTGENRATTAARTAISSPLLEISIDGAKGVLFNIIGGSDVSMSEVDGASCENPHQIPIATTTPSVTRRVVLCCVKNSILLLEPVRPQRHVVSVRRLGLRLRLGL